MAGLPSASHVNSAGLPLIALILDGSSRSNTGASTGNKRRLKQAQNYLALFANSSRTNLQRVHILEHFRARMQESRGLFIFTVAIEAIIINLLV